MLVPRFVEQLNKPHSALNQPPGEEAVSRKRMNGWVDAIQAQGFLGFLREIHKLRRSSLKLECHFIRLDPGLHFGIAHFGESHFIKSSNTIERRALRLGIPASGV